MESSLPRYLYLFGVAGSGKTFAGNVIAKRFDYLAYDLDQDATPAMKLAVAEKMPFTEEIRDEFFEIVVKKIRALMQQHQRIVFMQGTYKERHRELLRSSFPEMPVIWVNAPMEKILDRLKTRGDQVTPEYGKLLSSAFQQPTNGSALLNDGDEDRLVEEFLRVAKTNFR